jgi:hypothetical protein
MFANVRSKPLRKSPKLVGSLLLKTLPSPTPGEGDIMTTNDDDLSARLRFFERTAFNLPTFVRMTDELANVL